MKLPHVAKQLLDGLNHVHTAWVIHGDLKPANILLDNSSAMGDLKLAIGDFGSAMDSDAAPGSPASFANPKHLGHCNTTYEWRAPELFVSKKLRTSSYSADIWAVGCVIVYFDTYQAPFGRSRMPKSEVEKVFELALETLYGASHRSFDGKRENAKLFLEALKKLELKKETDLPWAKQQPMAFRGTIRSFFVADYTKRPSASKLAADKGLLEACKNSC